MSSEKTASIRITLNSGSYLAGLKQINREAERTGKQMGDSLKGPTIGGLKAMKAEMASWGGMIKGTLRLMGSFGGALGAAKTIHDMVDITAQFRNISFAIKAGKGAVVDWKDLMGDAQKAALKWGQSTQAVGDVFRSVYDEVADVGFAKAAMEEVAKAATATGQPIEELAGIAGTMNEKFGITAAELPNAMATIVSLGNQGGITLAEMSDTLAQFGQSAKQAGLSGVGGLSKILGVAALADDAIGRTKAKVTAIAALFNGMGTKEMQHNVLASFGVQTKGKDPLKALGEIFARTHGKKERLEQVFQGPEAALVVSLGAKFNKAYEEAKGTTEEKTKAAIKVYEEAMQKAAQANLDAADLTKQASDQMETPRKRMETAIERLSQAFARPEMIDSLEKMADKLPAVVDGIVKMLNFVMADPKMAIALVAGLKLGGTFAAGYLKTAIESGARSAASSIGGSMVSSGVKAGTSFAGAVNAAGLGATIGTALAAYITTEGIGGAEKNKKELGKVTSDLAQLPPEERKKALPGAIERVKQLKKERSNLDKTFGFSDVEFDSADRYLAKESKQAGFDSVSVSREAERSPFAQYLPMPKAAEPPKLVLNDDGTIAAAVADGLAKNTIKVQIVGGLPGGAPTNGPPPRGPMQLPPVTPGHHGR